MRAGLILLGVGLMIAGIILAAIWTNAQAVHTKEAWMWVGSYGLGGFGSSNSFTTYLSSGYYRLAAAGGSYYPSNALNSPYVLIIASGGRNAGEYEITASDPVYFQTYYGAGNYTFHFTDWYPASATLARQVYEQVTTYDYRDLVPVGIAVALWGLTFVIAGAILTTTPSSEMT